jgi:hypothetical protein
MFLSRYRTKFSILWHCSTQILKKNDVAKLEPISPTLNAQLFCTKVSPQAFLFLYFRFVLLRQKNIGAKGVFTMYFTNILRAYLRQKKFKP